MFTNDILIDQWSLINRKRIRKKKKENLSELNWKRLRKITNKSSSSSPTLVPLSTLILLLNQFELFKNIQISFIIIIIIIVMFCVLCDCSSTMFSESKTSLPSQSSSSSMNSSSFYYLNKTLVQGKFFAL